MLLILSCMACAYSLVENGAPSLRLLLVVGAASTVHSGVWESFLFGHSPLGYRWQHLTDTVSRDREIDAFGDLERRVSGLPLALSSRNDRWPAFFPYARPQHIPGNPIFFGICNDR